MVSNSPVSLSVLRGVCLRPVVMSLLFSLAGLSWYGGKYAVADAHNLPIYAVHSNKLTPKDIKVTVQPTAPSDYDLNSLLLNKLHQLALHDNPLPGSKSKIRKRQAMDKDLLKKIYLMIERFQFEQETNHELTMSSLRFR